MNTLKYPSIVKKAAWVSMLTAGLTISYSAGADNGADFPYQGGLASGQYKFLGNISGSSNQCNCSYTDWVNPANNGFDVTNHFPDYWNQLSPENSGKWGETEKTRGNYNWSAWYTLFNFDQYHNITPKEHTLVWGSQLPSWFGGASDKKVAVQAWIQNACAQLESYYGWTSGHSPMVDVVNEPVNTTTSDFDNFKNSISASDIGESASVTVNNRNINWIIWSFQKARMYCPNQKLLMNEYNVLHVGNAQDTTQDTYKKIATELKNRGLIDGLGTQSHQGEVDGMTAAQVTAGLASLATLKIPLYVTELDIDGCKVNGSGGGGTGVDNNSSDCGSDSIQSSRYQAVFPVLWKDPNVMGVTMWGYVQNETWNGYKTHLISTTGVDRPAMTWLKSYLASNQAPAPAANKLQAVSLKSVGTNAVSVSATSPATMTFGYLIPANRTIVVRAHGRIGGEKISVVVNGQEVAAWTLSTAWNTYTANSTRTGNISVQFNNDDGKSNGRDVQVDYITINGSLRQAEGQAVNTGHYANGKCGGAGYSEWLECNGSISFGAL